MKLSQSWNEMYVIELVLLFKPRMSTQMKWEKFLHFPDVLGKRFCYVTYIH